MPLHFQFTDTANEAVSLDAIDREVCEKYGLPYSATNYSLAYQALTWTGLAIAHTVSKAGRSEITPQDVDDYVTKNQDAFPEEGASDNLKKYLCGKYRFDVWFQR